jgi:hypothetical protein
LSTASTIRVRRSNEYAFIPPTLPPSLGRIQVQTAVGVARDVTLNCNGLTLRGLILALFFPLGIVLVETFGVTVKNCTITGFSTRSNRSRGGQAIKPAKNSLSRMKGGQNEGVRRVEMYPASASLAVKSRFSWIF